MLYQCRRDACLAKPGSLNNIGALQPVVFSIATAGAQIPNVSQFYAGLNNFLYPEQRS